MKYAIFAIPFLVISYPIYAFLNPSLETLIERQNALIDQANNEKLESYRAELIDCIDSATGKVLQEFDDCSRTPKPTLQERVGVKTKNIQLVEEKKKDLMNATGGIAPVPGYTSKHSLVLTGSHSYVKYSNRLGASWKNNNSAGLTWGVSPTLKQLWTDAGIRYRKGSLRPANEKGNYIYFETVEEGLRAKIIAIRERWGKATVEHYLSGWGTDYLKLSFDQSKIIKDLSDAEFTELFVQQMKKESPGYTSQLVQDGILIIQ